MKVSVHIKVIKLYILTLNNTKKKIMIIINIHYRMDLKFGNLNSVMEVLVHLAVYMFHQTLYCLEL